MTRSESDFETCPVLTGLPPKPCALRAGHRGEHFPDHSAQQSDLVPCPCDPPCSETSECTPCVRCADRESGLPTAKEALHPLVYAKLRDAEPSLVTCPKCRGEGCLGCGGEGKVSASDAAECARSESEFAPLGPHLDADKVAAVLRERDELRERVLGLQEEVNDLEEERQARIAEVERLKSSVAQHAQGKGRLAKIAVDAQNLANQRLGEIVTLRDEVELMRPVWDAMRHLDLALRTRSADLSGYLMEMAGIDAEILRALDAYREATND